MNIFIECSVASLPGPVSGDDICHPGLLCGNDNGAHHPLSISPSPSLSLASAYPYRGCLKAQSQIQCLTQLLDHGCY